MSAEDTDGFAQEASELDMFIKESNVAKVDSQQIPKGGPLVLSAGEITLSFCKPMLSLGPLRTEVGWKEWQLLGGCGVGHSSL